MKLPNFNILKRVIYIALSSLIVGLIILAMLLLERWQ